jgi:polyribonucleotide nucleotidyltransferase
MEPFNDIPTVLVCQVVSLLPAHSWLTAALAVTAASRMLCLPQSESLWSRRAHSRLHLHYSFPPFSVGEIGKQGQPNRREVGHGNLARAGIAGVCDAGCGRRYFHPAEPVFVV